MRGRSQPSTSPTQRIAKAVADAEGVDPVALDPPLFDVLDGERLNGLIRSNEQNGGETNLNVSFEYLGYIVHVAAGGRVSVDR